MRYSFCLMVSVKFYGDVIAIHHLQLINTSINTFFSKLRAFLAEQRRRRKASDDLKGSYVDGAVEESSADQKIRKLDATVRNL